MAILTGKCKFDCIIPPKWKVAEPHRENKAFLSWNIDVLQLRWCYNIKIFKHLPNWKDDFVT